MTKIIAKKVEMTQIFTDAGLALPVTLVILEDKETQSGALGDGDTVSVSGISKGKGFQGSGQETRIQGWSPFSRPEAL